MVDIVQFLYYNASYETHDKVVKDFRGYKHISQFYIDTSVNSTYGGYWAR
jgi:hypothetical protein